MEELETAPHCDHDQRIDIDEKVAKKAGRICNMSSSSHFK